MSRHERIVAALQSALAPTFLEVTNESHQHSVKPGSETHFKVVVVSAAFEGQSRVARQRLVHRSLAAELSSGLHALTSATFTAGEWAASPQVLASPECESRAKRSAGAAGGEPRPPTNLP
jgi:BolA family transcriptional regulator, general stress-responsive regulator